MKKIIIFVFLVLAFAAFYVFNTATLTAIPAQEKETCTDSTTGISMGYAQAMEIAEASDCTSNAELKTGHCDETTGSWRFGLEPIDYLAGCDSVCVVSIVTRTAEVDLNCQGALP